MFIDTDSRRMFTGLTSMQREVVELMGTGLTSKEMARELGVSPSAVDQRVNAIKRKLGVSSRGELKRLARGADQSILPDRERAFIAQALGSSLPERNEGSAVDADLSVTLTVPPVPARTTCPFLRHARFIKGFVLGFVSGTVVASAAILRTL